MAIFMKENKKRLIIISLWKNFMQSFKLFLQETGLHGLKFVGNVSLTIWERAFFLLAFIAAFVTTCHLISNIYEKWVSTPVIIGINPSATSILKVPFPAITICNVNQAVRSKASNYSEGSFENAILKLLCNQEAEISKQMQEAANFLNNSMRVADFIYHHSQPCSRLLLQCNFATIDYNCSDLFQEVLTDEGLCCVFNMLPPEFLNNYYVPHFETSKNISSTMFKPVNWNLETGYPSELPKNYYPMPAAGTGFSMGFSVVLDAQLDEYYCSSTNGPGFKIFHHNPIEVSNIKEAGLLVPIGHETRFRLELLRSEAVPNIRSINRKSRQCLFNNELSLVFYKYYTRQNCERECQARLVFDTCNCIPYNLPPVIQNASVCKVKDSYCVSHSKHLMTQSTNLKCFSDCLPSCYDLIYLPDGFSSSLASRGYKISNPYLRKIDNEYLQKNIAIVHFYYRESVYHGNLKNVYVGFTEFLSNIGGVMGLFLGFSFLSLAEIFYFLILKPIMDLISAQRVSASPLQHPLITPKVKNVWYTKELYPKGTMSRVSVQRREDDIPKLQMFEF